MTDEAQEAPDNGQDTGDQEPKTFDAEYVSGLRKEAANYRVQRNDLQERLAQLEKSQKEAEEQRLVQQNKWQELAEARAKELEDLSTYKERYETMLTGIKASNEQRIESIPEQMRTLVPAYDDPVKLSTWLDQNSNLLVKPSAPVMNGSAGNKDRPGETQSLDAEELKVAKQMGLTAKEYIEAKKGK